MTLDSLSSPISDSNPVGEDCDAAVQGGNLAELSEFVVETVLQRGLDRAAEAPGMDDAERANAEVTRDDGRRRLTQLEAVIKSIGIGSPSLGQVAKVLRERASTILSKQGKDLRVVPHLCVALTAAEGLDGYLASIRLATGLLREFGASLYPHPDPDDDTPDWPRTGAVSDLVAGDGILALLDVAVVIEGRQSGRLTLADLAGGMNDRLQMPEASTGDIEFALADVGPEAAAACAERLAEMEAAVSELASMLGASAPPVVRTATGLGRAAARVAAWAEGRTGAGGGDEPPRPGGAPAGSDRPARSNSAGGHQPLQTRQDAIAAIEGVIRLVEQLEPGHPAPLLLRRANRLLQMSFIDIIRDLAPNALNDIELIVGSQSSE